MISEEVLFKVFVIRVSGILPVHIIVPAIHFKYLDLFLVLKFGTHCPPKKKVVAMTFAALLVFKQVLRGFVILLKCLCSLPDIQDLHLDDEC